MHTRKRVASAFALALLCGQLAKPGLGDPQAPAGALAQEVLGVFRAKCAGCHGTQLRKPKGRFGYVDDLARLAQNPEIIIPGSPDESELWQLVAHGEMPPEESPRGALNRAQKETIRAWIAAGAPAAVTPSRPPHSPQCDQ